MDNISTELQHDIEARIETGRYASREELLRDALRALDEQDEVESLLLKALDKNEWVEVTPGFWEEKKRRLQERFAPKS